MLLRLRVARSMFLARLLLLVKRDRFRYHPGFGLIGLDTCRETLMFWFMLSPSDVVPVQLDAHVQLDAQVASGDVSNANDAQLPPLFGFDHVSDHRSASQRPRPVLLLIAVETGEAGYLDHVSLLSMDYAADASYYWFSYLAFPKYATPQITAA